MLSTILFQFQFGIMDLTKQVLAKLENLTTLFQEHVSENGLLRSSVDQQCGLLKGQELVDYAM